MTRPTTLRWLGLALLAACGGSATVASTETTADAVAIEAPAPEPDPTAYLPADTYLLVEVDVARLRTSPYYPMVVEALKATDEIDAQREDLLHTLAERTSRIWFAGVPTAPGRGGDLGCIIVQGDYDPGQPEAALRQMVPNPEDLQQTEVAGHMALESRGGMMAQLTERAWIIGPPDRVKPLLLDPPGNFAAASDPAWAQARQWLPADAGITLVALGTDALRYDMAHESPMDDATAAHLRAAGVAFDAADGLDVAGMVLMDDGAVAESVVQWVDATLAQLAQNMIVSMLSLGPILESVDARAEGTVAGARLHVADGEVRRLLGMLPNMLAQ